MRAIARHEFWQHFKSVKSILVIVILLGASYYVAQNGATFIQLVDEELTDQAVYYSGLSLVLLLVGPLFALTLSHDVMNRELSGKTMRFLLTRTSHARIILGKLLGVCSFWLMCLLCAYAVIIFYARHIELYLFFELFALLFFSVSLAFLLSVVIAKPFVSMFVSMVLGLLLPLASLFAISTEQWWGVLGYLTPYQYMQHDDWQISIVLLIGAAIIGLAYTLLKRRTC